MANFDHFYLSSRFPPKQLIFHQISKFLFPGAGYISQFSKICNFLNCFQPKWLKMTHNGQFCHQSGLDWLKMANFSHFSTFLIFSHKKQLRLIGNGQFCLICNFFNLFSPKQLNFCQILKFSFLGGVGWYISQFSQICSCLNHFKLKWFKMTHNGQFCHQSGLDWLEMANFSHFSTFPIFSHKKQLRLTGNGQFCLICNFSNLFLPKWLKMTHSGNFATEVAHIGSKWPILVIFQLFPSFPTESGSDCLRMANFT